MTALVSNGDYLLILLGMGLVTYLPRWIPLIFLSRRELPTVVVQWLDLIPVAILSALLAPALFTRGDPRTFAPLQPEMWVALPTFFVAWRFKSLGGTVLAGMVLFWLVEKIPY